MKNTNSCNATLFYILMIFSIILIILIIYYFIINKKNNNIEKFDDFSPFNNNCAKEEDDFDKENLKKLRDEWEKPYNNNNFGYQNAEPLDLPPLVPINSYPILNFHSMESPLI